MANKINGLKDIHKLLVNERKIGGVIEVNTLRLELVKSIKMPSSPTSI